MTSHPTPAQTKSIATLLKSLNDTIIGANVEMNVLIDVKTGEHLHAGRTDRMSNHASLAYEAKLQAVIDWIKDIPLLTSLGMPSHLNINRHHTDTSCDFALKVCGFTVTKVSSSKYTATSRAIDHFVQRLREVEVETSTLGDVKHWMVEADGHDRGSVYARSAYQAVRVFAAVHVRSKHDQEHWRDTITKTRGVSRICAPSEWTTGP